MILLSFSTQCKLDSIPKWNRINTQGTRITTSGFDYIYQKVKNKFGFQPCQWQVAVILNVFYGIDLIVSARTSVGKILLYQVISIILPNVIILVVLPIIALIKDQVRSIKTNRTSAVALTLDTNSKD